jgi:hypothetical protein
MKKTFTIVSAILITFLSFTAKAQDDKPQAKSYIDFWGGQSIPTGSFKQTDYSNNSAGFAKTSVTLGLDVAIYVYKNLAIATTLSFQDQGELSQSDAAILADGYNTSFKNDETTVTIVNRYHNVNLMTGPQYTFMYKKFTLDLRAYGGIVKSTSTPAITVLFDFSSSPGQTLYQYNSTAWAFGYGGGAGLRYSLSDSWDAGIKVNYVDCPGIKIGNAGNPNNIGRIQTKLPITEIQAAIGMTLKF